VSVLGGEHPSVIYSANNGKATGYTRSIAQTVGRAIALKNGTPALPLGNLSRQRRGITLRLLIYGLVVNDTLIACGCALPIQVQKNIAGAK